MSTWKKSFVRMDQRLMAYQTELLWCHVGPCGAATPPGKRGHLAKVTQALHLFKSPGALEKLSPVRFVQNLSVLTMSHCCVTIHIN